MRQYLLDTESETFKFIIRFKKENDGISPTLREIVDNTIVKSTSHANEIVRNLESMGLVKIRPWKSRGIVVVGGSWRLDYHD